MNTLASSLPLPDALQARAGDNRWWREATLASLVLLALCLCLSQVDPRTLLGVSVWTKPAKFYLSIAVYFATLLLCARFLADGFWRTVRGRALTLMTLSTAIFELAYISAQAALGEASHFNGSSAFHGVMYSLMGVGAVLLVLGSGWLGIEIALQRGLESPLVLAVVLGLLLTVLLGGGFGGVLSSNGGHWVGSCRDDVDGLALLGWSRECGDLRVAHFWGMHAMQALPLGALVLGSAGAFSERQRWLGVWIGAVVYAAIGFFLFFTALHGEPILG
ncbi:MAG: hypothetical protein AAGI15_02445 [Pseudomonadota bacterium]